MKTSYAQDTQLRLKIEKGISGKTIIKDMFFTPPLKIIAPIYENDRANIMLLNVSAGLMNGDNQNIEIIVKMGSKLKLTSQSYEKIHNTEDGFVQRNTIINIEEQAELYYIPLPCIPFANSSFINTTKIYLHNDSVLYYGEVFCAGRVGRGEIFAFKLFHSKLQIYRNNELVLFDNMKLSSVSMNFHNMCMFDIYTHYLNLIIHDKEQNKEKLQQILLESGLNAGISFSNNFFIIKVLGNTSEELLELQDRLLFRA